MAELSRGVRAGAALAGVTIAFVLLAGCGGSGEAPADLLAPPVEPITVPGLALCDGLEADGGVSDVPSGLPGVDLPCFNEARKVDLARLKGPAVINLWATWCGPCRKEMPMLAQEAQRNPDIQFVGINTQDRGEQAADLLVSSGVHYPQLVDVDGLVLADTRVPGLPVTLAIDEEGTIIDRVIGEVSREELAALLDTLAK